MKNKVTNKITLDQIEISKGLKRTSDINQQLRSASNTVLGGLLTKENPLTVQERNALAVFSGLTQAAYSGKRLNAKEASNILNQSAESRMEDIRKKRGNSSLVEQIKTRDKKQNTKTIYSASVYQPLLMDISESGVSLGGNKKTLG